MENLGLDIPQYDRSRDPVRRVALGEFPAETEELCLDWTQDAELARDRASNEPLQRLHHHGKGLC